MSNALSRREPEWFRVKLPQGSIAGNVQRIIKEHSIHTICSSGVKPIVIDQLKEVFGFDTA